ncbi:MAG TPA: M20/M25/M40 family metallo-hydrolase [Pyrinomonadaceae bacterium]|nr:M20/M25/M40 family metallo-hydrolase [Pyrinomonadaceae bacterium]
MDQTISSAKPHRRPLLVTSRIGDVPGVLTFLFILCCGAFSLYQGNSPAAVSADADTNSFSSGRAIKHLQAITKQPHPPGSIEHANVRQYIVEALRSYGLEPEIQTATAIDRQRDTVLLAGTVRNVIAKLQGTENSKAILVTGHYDTSPQAFGASDDGAAVVAMLESVRALKAGPPLKNDVIFLFTDAEEEGLLGANGFISEHPLARDVGLVLNFEARGNGGPSIMFETSNNNGWLIPEFAKAAPHPVANSLSYEIYKRLPNTTDFTVFKNRGLDGLNFAYIDGLSSYHTPLDNIQRINEGSLQHHGTYVLALTRHFGNVDLRQIRSANAVYFDVLGSTLIHYPYSWIVPLSILVLILLAALVIVGLRAKYLTVRGMILGCLAFVLTTAVITAFAQLLWLAIFKLRYESEERPLGETYYSNLYFIGFIALAIAVTTALYNLFRRKTSTENLAVGGLVWWAILMLLTSFYLPGASYLFTWPLMFSVVGLTIGFVLRQRNHHSPAIPILLLSALPGLMLLIPVTYQIFVGLTLNSIAIVAVLVLLQIGLLIPHLNVMARANKWSLPVLAGLVSMGFLAAGLLITSSDRQHPKPDNIFYALNADTGKAVWASMDQRPDEWTSQLLSTTPENKPLSEFFSPNTRAVRFRQNSAPVATIAAPQIVVLNDQNSGGVRLLRLRITSTRLAPLLFLYVDSKAEFLSMMVNGTRLDPGNSTMLRNNKQVWNMQYVAPPAEGVEVALEFKAQEPLKIRVVDQSYSLPEIPNLTIARPDNTIPSPNALSDATLVSKTYSF